jgi:hypothetical protein
VSLPEYQRGRPFHQNASGSVIANLAVSGQLSAVSGQLSDRSQIDPSIQANR